jgi:glutathione S-transferase
MSRPALFGASYSVYVRSARLALEEKGVDYRLEEVDVFAPGGPSASYLERQPFGKIPALEHDGFRLYECSAIIRYVDAAFPGPCLRPDDARAAARVDQVISLLDSYAYRTLVWDIFVERIRAPERGRAPDEARIRAALPGAANCLGVLEALSAGGRWLAGPELSLADLHAAPMIALFRQTPEGADMLVRYGGLAEWWQEIAQRPSMVRTAPAGVSD